MTDITDKLVEDVALAILNSDRTMRGLPALNSRDNVPDSDGYALNARAALAAALPVLREDIEGIIDKRMADFQAGFDRAATDESAARCAARVRAADYIHHDIRTRFDDIAKKLEG